MWVVLKNQVPTTIWARIASLFCTSVTFEDGRLELRIFQLFGILSSLVASLHIEQPTRVKENSESIIDSIKTDFLTANNVETRVLDIPLRT